MFWIFYACWDSSLANDSRSDVDHCFKACISIACTHGDLSPEALSIITRVCGFGFCNPRFRFGQAHRARCPQIAQAHDALLRVFDF